MTSAKYEGESRSTSKYKDPDAVSTLATADLESNDVKNCAAYVVNNYFATQIPQVSGKPPVIIVDSAYFDIRTSQRLDKDLIIDLLRGEMINASRGRFRFVNREKAAIVAEENALQDQGVVGEGTLPSSSRQLRADYRLSGRITELSENAGQRIDKYHVMLFELTDTATGEIVFNATYDFKKTRGAPGTAYP